MTRASGVLLSFALLAGCEKPAAPKATRLTIKRTSGSSFEVIPAEGQPPYCLIFTVSKSGLTRQLTMSPQNSSFACPAGKPVEPRGYRVPLSDGPVTIYTLFSSTDLNATSISQQILEAPDRQHLSAMNLRLPGNAVLEVSTFTPEADAPALVGAQLGVTPTDEVPSAEARADGGGP